MFGGNDDGVLRPTNLIANWFALSTSLFSTSRLTFGYIRVDSVLRSL